MAPHTGARPPPTLPADAVTGCRPALLAPGGCPVTHLSAMAGCPPMAPRVAAARLSAVICGRRVVAVSGRRPGVSLVTSGGRGARLPLTGRCPPGGPCVTAVRRLGDLRVAGVRLPVVLSAVICGRRGVAVSGRRPGVSLATSGGPGARLPLMGRCPPGGPCVTAVRRPGDLRVAGVRLPVVLSAVICGRRVVAVSGRPPGAPLGTSGCPGVGRTWGAAVPWTLRLPPCPRSPTP
ncbi:hypothetical protein ABT272_30460 [Streptomyces sp900105245]|uniref:Uncharacterized protein n=1 Tax=Streptomyces sp. 900105245 TaxID=3154379 RepID=A0ABV1UE76_9ACTN